MSQLWGEKNNFSISSLAVSTTAVATSKWFLSISLLFVCKSIVFITKNTTISLVLLENLLGKWIPVFLRSDSKQNKTKKAQTVTNFSHNIHKYVNKMSIGELICWTTVYTKRMISITVTVIVMEFNIRTKLSTNNKSVWEERIRRRRRKTTW